MGEYFLSQTNKMRHLALPNYAILLVASLWLITMVSSEKWQQNNSIRDDVIYYYSYLPALFIYQDLSFEFVDELPLEIAENIWINKDSQVPKMTMGLSVLYSPFFAIAHTYATVFDRPNGYSSPYHLMLLFGAFVYGVIGLIFLKNSLLQYYDPKVVAIVLVCISLGTNLYCYVGYEGAMSHSYSFFLFSVFIYLSLLWNNQPNILHAIALGCIGGLIVLVRPANWLIWILPLFFNVQRWESVKERFNWLTVNYKSTLAMVVFALLIVLPQLLYWKTHTGDWIYYAYQDEGFYFLNSHIIDGLFSYKKGWFLYTPMVLFAFIGLLYLKRYCGNLYSPILLFLPINIYFIFSWWCWWYGGGFSARPFIESYAVLSFPFCAFISETLKSKNRIKKTTIAFVATFFLLLNIFQSKQYDVAILHWDSMTKEAYWGIFGKSERPINYLKLVSSPDYERAFMGEEELNSRD